MATISTALLVLLLGFVALLVVTQIMVAARARAPAGQPAPPLPGALGERVARSERALVYFFSPMCVACRSITPRIRALAQKDAVFAVDVSQSTDAARALRVMATPSTVEIADGKIVGVHIGPVPEEVLARFA